MEATAVKESEKLSRDWDKITLEVEVRTLQRELTHLAEKKRERMLSYWEEERLTQIPNDISHIMSSGVFKKPTR